MVLVFPNDAALHFALTSGLASPTLSLAPARIGRDAAGRPWIASTVAVPDNQDAELRRIGVLTLDNEPSDGRIVANLLQALPLRRDRVAPALTDQTTVLFELPNRADLTKLVGEMLCLGNDRQVFRTVGASAFLKVIGPPYYTLLRAINRAGPDGPRAFLERSPRVWVEVGWTHPLIEQIDAPAGQLLLLQAPQEWTAIADVSFHDIYDGLEFQIPDQTTALSDDRLTDKLAVPLRLTAGAATEAAELWVLNDDAVDQVDTLVHDADNRLLARLAFAIGDQCGKQTAVLRVRPGKAEMPNVVLENAMTFRSYLRLPNLYLPVGQSLRPPLRRDTVRRLLAENFDEVVWLSPAENDSFVAQSLPESAFRPLSDWVEYVMSRNAAVLTTWPENAQFDFESFVGRQEVVADERPARLKERKPRGATAAVAEAAKARLAAAKPKIQQAAPVPQIEALSSRPLPTPSEAQIRLKETEEQFLAVDGPLDDSRRLGLWPELGRLNALLGHRADAGIAWANALWEPNDSPSNWAWNWMETEKALPQTELTAADLDRLLANEQPAAPDLRPLAATLIWAGQQKPIPAELLRRLPEVQRYLERHDHLLPVRALWLTWHALAGTDVLTLARVRDRLLERLLAEGLGAERDLPGFLRYAGQRDGDRLRPVRERAERLQLLAHTWSGFAPGEALQQTAAYIDLLFAFGFARLGEAEIARSLAQQAGKSLEASGSEAHTFLLEAFRYRIDQAVAGKPHAGPLPTEQLEYLEQMHRDTDALPKDDLVRRLPPYVIERLKEQSQILEPHEKFDPYRRIKHEADDQIREVVRLADVHDRGIIAAGVRRLCEQAARSPRLPETRLRVLAESLTLAGRVGEALTAELLAHVGPALDASGPNPSSAEIEKQAILLERALLFAAHYDLPDLVRAFSDRLGSLLKAPAAQSAFDVLGRLVGQTLRSLRKLGLKDQTERLLQQIADAALGGRSLDEARARAGQDWQQTLRLLLHLAAGWYYFDQPELARPILDVARAWILSPEKNGGDRPAQHYVPLVCTYIAAAGQAPQGDALERIEELFSSGKMDPLPNTFTTRQFFSRFHLNIVEAVIMTLATDDFALGPAARRWLDDDEFLVRRRIHRDVREALNRAGM